ncbi:hypothetical protein FS837_003850, partial [Tulasnella sp. UAMH 9824]
MLAKNTSLSPDDPDLQADATRAGSRALLWSSILSLGSSILLPFIVHQSSFDSDEDKKPWANGSGRSRRKDDPWARVFQWLKSMRIHLATLWMISQLLFAITKGLTLSGSAVERQQLMFNAEDQFRDDDHPRDSKGSGRRRDPEARSPYGLSNDEGIHNIFGAIHQFLVTRLSSILFALLESHKSVLDQGHAGHLAAGNVPTKNITDATSAAVAEL